MYKIMLADEESMVIDSLRYIIEKAFAGKCEVRSAKTGRDAIELAEDFRPDISLIDMQMPGINGIDVMREIRQNNESMIFIVMSEYDRFFGVRELVALGVMACFAKPIEQGSLLDVFRKAFSVIDRAKQKRSNELVMKEKLETILPILENGLVYHILFQEHFEEELSIYKTALNIEQRYAYMMAFVCADGQDGSSIVGGVKLKKYDQEIRRNIKGYFNCMVGTVTENKLAVLVPCTDLEIKEEQRLELIEKIRELVRHMGKHLGIRLRVGIGRVKEFQNAGASFGEAKQAMARLKGCVVHAEDLPPGEMRSMGDPMGLEKELLTQIENGDLKEVIATSQDLFRCLEECPEVHTMDIRLKLLECVLYTEHVAAEKGAISYQLHTRTDYLPELMQMSQPYQLKQWFLQKTQAVCRSFSQYHCQKSNSAMALAEKYIQNNFSKNLSLNNVSIAAGISPYCFSKLFKASTDKTFIEYLTKIRIEKAQALLLTSDYSIKEICRMTGYADPNYFSRAFKTHVGITPTEYKKGKKQSVEV